MSDPRLREIALSAAAELVLPFWGGWHHNSGTTTVWSPRPSVDLLRGLPPAQSNHDFPFQSHLPIERELK
jgi:hypothetical protein